MKKWELDRARPSTAEAEDNAANLRERMSELQVIISVIGYGAYAGFHSFASLRVTVDPRDERYDQVIETAADQVRNNLPRRGSQDHRLSVEQMERWPAVKAAIRKKEKAW